MSGDVGTTSYFITLRPCLEILSVTPSSDGGEVVTAAHVLLSPRSPTSADGSDILPVVSALSLEAAQLVRRHLLMHSRSSLLLLLATGGICSYLVFKGRTQKDGGPRGRTRASRWRQRGWLWWIFGDEEITGELIEDSHGRYFGPTIIKSENLDFTSSSGRHHHKRVNIREELNSVATEFVRENQEVAPCPNCVRGSCKIRRHQLRLLEPSTSTSSSSYNNSPMHQSNCLALPPTSTPESADDEASDAENDAAVTALERLAHSQSRFYSRFFRPDGTRMRGGDGAEMGASPLLSGGCRWQANKSTTPEARRSSSRRATTPIYSASSEHRVPPVGQELPPSPVVPYVCTLADCTDSFCCLSGRSSSVCRDESMGSIKSVSGSMVDLVRGAREVRRLIREASLDSLVSEFSLDFLNEDIGTTTERKMNVLRGELSLLKDRCGEINERVEAVDVVPSKMTTSKSDYVVSGGPCHKQDLPSGIDGSFPDIRTLQKPKRHLWMMTTGDSSESPHRSTAEESLEWESPLHGWHDVRQNKYKLALSSSCSECGDGLDAWEWDCEGVTEFEDWNVPASMLNHQKWLPESADRIELDLEAELQSSNYLSGVSSYANSRTSSRRSSYDKSFYVVRQPPSGRSSVNDGFTTRQSIDHETLVKSFGKFPDQPSNSLTSSQCSDESGFQEGGSSNTMLHSSIVTLSPVHEAKEPSGSVTATPKKTPVEMCNKKKLFQSDDSETLKIVVQDFAANRV